MNGKCPTPRAQKTGKSPPYPGGLSGIHLIVPLTKKLILNDARRAGVAQLAAPKG